ncbi:unnamed protein product [Adineta steineri]|uniref:G-protein coupled receptors family 1 profile domain-containing protein n=1 Tax=Adineta steineri TaxID=433720 RepID=A0A814WW05_9BILA|nr:unnamed protein product [Adineta steineri]
MDCFLTYNLSCINGTYTQFNSSSIIFGDALHPNLIAIGDNSNTELTTSTIQPISSSIFISLQHCIITVIILGAIILSTITGNILVIAAIILEKSLHAVAYYLFVSLAVTDLMIASIVMPIAVLKEVTRHWVLGTVICDIWVAIDLLCCTASILHLLAIALDRYWAITNLDYATKRTPLRVLILICVVWVTAILISSCHLLPIFRDKRRRPVDQCHVTGNVLYTIFSTVGAFHIPLIGMCIIYWKIFQAAKFRIRRKGFNTNQPTSPTLLHQKHATISASPTLTLSNNTDLRKSALNRIKFLKKNHYINHHAQDIEPDKQSTCSLPANLNTDYQLKPIKKSNTPLLKKQLKKKCDDEIQQQQTNNSPSTTGHLKTTSLSLHNDLPIQVHTIKNPLATSNLSSSTSSRIHDAHLVVTDTSNAPVTKSSAAMLRKKIDLKRERKATKVLGVVMGCFILCWLPFFIEETICGIFRLTIHEKIVSVLTWLGYFNSLLNPVIYTIFAPDFRQAFGKILCGRYRKRR